MGTAGQLWTGFLRPGEDPCLAVWGGSGPGHRDTRGMWDKKEVGVVGVQAFPDTSCSWRGQVHVNRHTSWGRPLSVPCLPTVPTPAP